VEDAFHAYREAAHGDFRRAEAAIAALSGAVEGERRAFALAIRALFDATVGGVVEPVGEGEIRALATSPNASAPLALALHHRALAAFIAFDGITLATTTELARELSAKHGSVGYRAVAETGALAASVLVDAATDALDDRVVRDAARECDPGLAIHHESLRALAALASASMGEALAIARRASRMAATEGLLQSEYFANIVLARVRRGGGRGHLAVRILTSLASVVPAPWRTWVGLERALAGAVEGTPLGDAITALEAGDGQAFRRNAAAVAEHAEGFRALAREVQTLVELVDPFAAPSASSRAWILGETDASPSGLRDPARSPMAIAYVVVDPERPARRVLTAGARLLPADTVLLSPTASALRTHHALALVALAGPAGIEIPELFEKVYGFALSDPTHEEVFRGLLHRARAALGDAGDMQRAGDRLRIEVQRTILVPDPRCEVSLTDRILTFVAGSGGRATARTIADALRIPLRTTQRALAELVEDGSCSTEPDGRRVEYVVEDTTFHEPTLHRLRGRRD
jgi:hypothetical protein